MVPVLDQQNQPLMPCSEKRARKLLTKGQAFSFWKRGVFCIRLLREPSVKNFQRVVCGIDPGSKREAYTVTTEKKVVLNILTDTPCWIKNAVKTRREMRKTRRFRNTPCRKPKQNNLRNKEFLAPSTRARWQAKLRILDWLSKIIPITDVVIEDIKARSWKNAKVWNTSFSPLEVGKEWFYQNIDDRGYNLHAVGGYDTKRQRDLRGFIKSHKKLEDTWNSHNVDSHSLCEILLKSKVDPTPQILRISFLQFHRRQLHMLKPEVNGKRRRYGGTISLGLKRGSLIGHVKRGLCYLGGWIKNRGLSLHDLNSGKRLCKEANVEDCLFRTYLSWRYHYMEGKVLSTAT